MSHGDAPERPDEAPSAWDRYNGVVKDFYEAGAWATTPWKGRIVAESAADLLAYAEIVHALQPKWIVNVGTGHGGAAWFFGDLLDGLSRGRCLTVSAPGDTPPDHRRVLNMPRATLPLLNDPATVAEAAEKIGQDSPVVVHFNAPGVLEDVAHGLVAWSRIVTPGSYLVVVGTVSALVARDGEYCEVHKLVEAFLETNNPDPLNPKWVADADKERHGLTLNSGGYLYRRY